jgi:hypothetical protein
MEIKKLNSDIIKERFGIEFSDDNYRLAFMTTMKRVYGEKSVASNLVLEENTDFSKMLLKGLATKKAVIYVR